jgi:3-phenylpropionate/trans-cinnamate dioxygenase ferredoxin reductase component
VLNTSVFAIIGASLAGARAAEALRAAGFDGRIALIGAERHPPYERPPLSKSVLLGLAEPSSVLLRSDWDDLDVELIIGDGVTAISPGQRRLELGSGASLRADKILLATGGRCLRLNVPGADLAGVHTLRELDDATGLGGELVPGAKVVVIGGGFIGLEVAASARTLGCDVTVVEAASVPLSRGLGSTYGTFVAEQHIARGVRVGVGVGARAILGVDRVTGVELDDGTVLPADVVVVGIGIVPRTELAAGLGIEVGQGIVVDAAARTANPAVFAAGDVTVQPAWRGDRLVRYESYQNAQEQAAVAAASMLGRTAAERDVPWFWSDQFDLNIQIAGDIGDPDEVAVRGDPDAPEFIAFHLRADTVAGVFAINRGKEVRAAMKLIAAGVPVAAEELTDESVDLRRLVRRAPTQLRPQIAYRSGT